MPRYAAFLRGVSPTNARMPAVKSALEAAGFTEVRTLLSSGNVVFSARAGGAEEQLARRVEDALEAGLGRSFRTFIRSAAHLDTVLASDPFSPLALPSGAKRVVTFLGMDAPQSLRFPIVLDDARIISARGREAFCFYVPGREGPRFMTLLERTFGKEITTRTWETVRKTCAACAL